MAKFEEVLNINVNDKTEKKGTLTYLSWSWAWAEFKKVYPAATYEVKKFNGLPYVKDEKVGYMVYTTVTAEELTYEMWLPVMDSRNKAILQPTMFEINKTIMRCLTKNLAMFGLGLYIYAGEDLPEEEQTAPKEEPRSPQKAKETLEPPAKAEAPFDIGEDYKIKPSEYTKIGYNYETINEVARRHFGKDLDDLNEEESEKMRVWIGKVYQKRVSVGLAE